MPAPLPLHSSIPAHRVAVIGNDVALAALPARPVQLAHACLRAGFDLAVPGSWGDELLAESAIRALGAHGHRPAILCACPLVTRRILSSGSDLAEFCVPLVPPAVAVARYVRAAYGTQPVHITYIGACPGARDPLIDAVIIPELFLGSLAQRGIVLVNEPLVFDSVIPPDRRRHLSLPGGCPTAESLWAECDGRGLVEVDAEDVPAEVAQRLLANEHVLIDMATRLGCACSGISTNVSAHSARIAVMSLEPPRSVVPILDAAIHISVDAPLPRRVAPAAVRPMPFDESSPRRSSEGDTPRVGRRAESDASDEALERIEDRPRVNQRTLAPLSKPSFLPDEAPLAAAVAEPSAPRATPDDSTGLTPVPDAGAPRRTTPPPFARHHSGSFPRTRTNSGEGPALPRAYVARRRAPVRTESAEHAVLRIAAPNEIERRIDISVEPPTPLERSIDIRVAGDRRFFADRRLELRLEPPPVGDRRPVLAADAPPDDDDYDDLDDNERPSADPVTMQAFALASAQVREASREVALDTADHRADEIVRRRSSATQRHAAEGTGNVLLIAMTVGIILLTIFVVASIAR